MKTMLLNLPKNLEKRFDFDQVAQPLGLAYISSFLKAHGYNATIFDANAYHLRRKQILDYVNNFNPDVLGLSVMTSQLPIIISFLNDLKRKIPKVQVVLGGPHVTTEYRSTLQSFEVVDMVVRGEGEYTMFHLLDILRTGGALDDVKGLCFKKDGNIKINEMRPYIEDLDTIPYPNWAALPMRRYWDVFTSKKNYARIIASRGCPYQCTFCGAHLALGLKHRKRSPENIIGELKLLYDHFHVREFLFSDSTFNIDNEWVSEICEAIIGMERPMIWRCNVRFDRLDKKTLFLMKKSGCVKVIMGIESADESILKTIKKGETIKQIKKGLNTLNEVGMPSDHGFIIGLPGETEDSIMKSIEFAKEIKNGVVTFSLATPFPGTEFYNIAMREGLEVDDWSKFDFYGVPYVPSGMTKEQLQKYFRYTVKTFYLRPSYLFKRLLNIKSWINLKIYCWFAFRIFQRRFKLGRKSRKIILNVLFAIVVVAFENLYC